VSLPKRNLDDKGWALIVDEARALIPRVAPTWTDHNVHDPGITFVELFAWLAEIQQYRLNRVAEFSMLRFLDLAGVTRKPQRPATARLAIQADAALAGRLVPAHSPVNPVGRERFAFETERDTFLTASKLTDVRTIVGGREVDQTRANADPAAHFAAFGPSPNLGDAFRLGFDRWFAEPEIHLFVELYERGLPPRVTLSRNAAGFVSSAGIRWEYLAANGWQPLITIEDETLRLSRSGRIRFQTPANARKDEERYWIRGTLASGSYELAPNIAEVSTNALAVRQAARIVNEDLGVGLGVPDQVVRVKNAPLLMDEVIEAGPFEVGAVLDWQTTIMRLARAGELHHPQDAVRVQRVADMLGDGAQKVLRTPELIDRAHPAFREPTDDERRAMASAFDALLDDDELYDQRTFGGVRVPAELRDLTFRAELAAAGRRQRRRFNRALLQAVFADQIVGDRLVVQVGTPVEHPEQEPKSWTTWERTVDLSQSAPSDQHYMLNAESGEIRFGNGLNGRMPTGREHIRARLYVHSRGADGNIAAGQSWRFADPRLTARGRNAIAASGGASKEPLEDTALRARGEFRTRSRAVTSDDYVDLVTKTPGLRIAQVLVLPQFHPRLPCVAMPGHVTVVVLPYALESTGRPPHPSEGFLATVERHLSAARLVTTTLHVIAPTFVPVDVGCTVFLGRGANEGEARLTVQRRLNTFLDPVRGGPDGSGWPFGRSVFASEIHALLLQDDAVESVAWVTLNHRAPEQPLPLPSTGLPTAGRHAVTVIPFEQRREGDPMRRTSRGQGEHGHG